MAKILLVDDDEGVRTTLGILLNFTNQVQLAESAMTALDMMKQDNFECLISDIKMPAMTGIELLEQVRKIYPSLPVILISGHLDIDKDEVLNLGAEGILWKPFDVSELETMVQNALDKRVE